MSTVNATFYETNMSFNDIRSLLSPRFQPSKRHIFAHKTQTIAIQLKSKIPKYCYSEMY